MRAGEVEAWDDYTRRCVELYAAYDDQCQREGVVDFAELLLRSYELLERNAAAARALPGALPAHPGRRVPGHQHAAVPVAQACWPARRRVGVRGRRRRPEHLCVPRRQRRQHGGVRARVPGREPDQARAELPFARQHPRLRERADRAQPPAARQEPVDRCRRRRAGARLRVDDRRPGSAVAGRGDPRPGRATGWARATWRCCTVPTRSRA